MKTVRRKEDMSYKRFNTLLCLLLWMSSLVLCSCRQGEVQEDLVAITPVFYGESQTVGETKEPSLCIVYVCGEVKNPGIVELPEGSRIAEALKLAGGFTEQAATDVVNLAAFIEDGQQIIFPDKETAKAQKEQKLLEDSGKVNLNTATLEQLMSLPGIGESRAKDILAYREKTGGFQKCEELMQIPGIKENSFKKLEDKIVVE